MRNLNKQDTLLQIAQENNLDIIIQQLDVTDIESIQTTVKRILRMKKNRYIN